VVYLDKTNVNAKVVESGMARVNRKFLKALPVAEQYALLCAEKKAQETHAGLWAGEKAMAER
jgi:endonuclease YncB( thermonuclease family)